MAQVIKLKQSAVQGSVPSTTDLELGEVAVNTHDGKIFVKKNDGVESIVELGAGTTVNNIVNATTNKFEYIATASQTVFSGVDENGNTLVLSDFDNVTVTYDGFTLMSSDYTLAADSVTLHNPSNAGGEVIIKETGANSPQIPVGNGELRYFEYVATAGQTYFSGVDVHANNMLIEGTFVRVEVNGFSILPSEFSYNSGSVTLTTGVNEGLPVVVYNYLLNGPGIATKTALPAATLQRFNSVVFVVGDKMYVCTANSSTPQTDGECFWVALS